jgi:hypothetical protein
MAQSEMAMVADSEGMGLEMGLFCQNRGYGSDGGGHLGLLGPHRRLVSGGSTRTVARDGPPQGHGDGHDAGCPPRRWRASVLVIVIPRKEVSPVNAVSAMGAPLPPTIARLR